MKQPSYIDAQQRPFLPARFLAAAAVAFILGATTAAPPATPEPRAAAPQRQVEDGVLLVVKLREESVTQGTGFAIDEQGTVVTNSHVVSGVGEVYVIARGREPVACKTVVVDELLDLAILQARGKVPALHAGDARSVRVGERVATTGYPRQLSRSLLGRRARPVTTTGVVQGVHDRGVQIEGRQLVLLRTTAAVEPGNSGGPLYRLETGEVIGVMVSGLAVNKRLTGITFAIPINEVYGLQRRHSRDVAARR